MVGEREAEEVRRKSSQIEPGMGPSAGLEAKKIEAAIDAVVDAIPTECAVDERQSAPSVGGNLLLEPLSAQTEAIEAVRSRELGLKGCLRTSDRRAQILVHGVRLHATEHDLAAV
jgi:hypothetical protein